MLGKLQGWPQIGKVNILNELLVLNFTFDVLQFYSKYTYEQM